MNNIVTWAFSRGPAYSTWLQNHCFLVQYETNECRVSHLFSLLDNANAAWRTFTSLLSKYILSRTGKNTKHIQHILACYITTLRGTVYRSHVCVCVCGSQRLPSYPVCQESASEMTSPGIGIVWQWRTHGYPWYALKVSNSYHVFMFLYLFIGFQWFST